MEALKISLSALDVEWQRLQVIAQNLANMNSTRNDAGGTFLPMSLVSGPDLTFSQILSLRGKPSEPTGIKVVGLEPQAGGIRRAYDPSHPNADPNGFVSHVNVDHAREMTLMIKTSRVYEANLTAVTIAQQMYNRALEIGRQS
jgi:flagellar basal-body rod protein FlgC